MERRGAALGTAPGTAMVAAAFNTMARAVPAFKGLEFKALAEGGAAVAAEPAGDGPTVVAPTEVRT